MDEWPKMGDRVRLSSEDGDTGTVIDPHTQPDVVMDDFGGAIEVAVDRPELHYGWKAVRYFTPESLERAE